jgi:hypothetical protein
MALAHESSSLVDLTENCELLLYKHTIKNNADLKNRLDDLLKKVRRAKYTIVGAKSDIEFYNNTSWISDEQKLRWRAAEENKIRQLLEDLNNRYIEINNDYQEIKRIESIPFYTKIYNRFKGRPPLNVPSSSANTGPVLATPIIDDEFSFNENVLPSAETTAYLPPLANAYLPLPTDKSSNMKKTSSKPPSEDAIFRRILASDPDDPIILRKKKKKNTKSNTTR